MTHLKERVARLMQTRAAVIEALCKPSDSGFGRVAAIHLTMEQEQIVATYVMALMTEDVADAIYKEGPT